MKYFDIMKTFCSKLDINFSNQMYEKFNIYMEMLIEYNKNINLTAIRNRDEIVSRHFLDSLSIFNYKIKYNSKLCDVGSGAGFPGIPIKIIRSDINVDLIESISKKTKFLNNVITTLNLDNIRVINIRVEELAHNKIYREKYDYVVSRAMARLNELLELSFPLVKVNGKYIAFKGLKSMVELNEAINAIRILGGEFENIINIPEFNSNLIVINKVFKTPEFYPREYRLIAKKSL